MPAASLNEPLRLDTEALRFLCFLAGVGSWGLAFGVWRGMVPGGENVQGLADGGVIFLRSFRRFEHAVTDLLDSLISGSHMATP